ncbi:MAG: Archaeal PaREP1/PaREP8 family protein [Candidatus Bathyarchaeota archaeon BA1]|nr:MAG: Archaeal PaREP1/PaREP8 family protein [Candidatus Bathyarchaeota archaeon BA1]
METVKHHLELNRKYLSEGESLLAKGDPVQASEKLWGAAAEMVKAVAADRGMELRTHADLWMFITKLRDELNDPEITRLFSIAGMLHQNFYEASMTLEAVRDSAESIKQFINKLERLAAR